MYSSTLTSLTPFKAVLPTARVLVIESNITLCRLFDQALPRAGFRTFFGATDKQAHELLKSFQPDIVLIDFDLPNVNVPELIRSIKARTSNQPPIIIALAERDRHYYQGLDVAYFFAKPVRIGTMIDVLRRFSVERATTAMFAATG